MKQLFFYFFSLFSFSEIAQTKSSQVFPFLKEDTGDPLGTFKKHLAKLDVLMKQTRGQPMTLPVGSSAKWCAQR